MAARVLALASFALFLAFLTPLPATAATQDLGAIGRTVEQYVREQTGDLPGKVDISLGTIDSRLRLPQCRDMQAFLPTGSRLWGNSMVGVRCLSPSPWSLYVPVTVKVMAGIVVAARPLSQGQALTSEDVTIQDADLTQLPAGTLTDPAEAVGKTLTTSVASGYALRIDMLRAPRVIRRGQVVKVVSRGHGFSVTSEGRAMADAGIGQVVSVRTPSGQVVSGIAKKEGVVEIPF